MLRLGKVSFAFTNFVAKQTVADSRGGVPIRNAHRPVLAQAFEPYRPSSLAPAAS